MRGQIANSGAMCGGLCEDPDLAAVQLINPAVAPDQAMVKRCNLAIKRRRQSCNRTRDVRPHDVAVAHGGRDRTVPKRLHHHGDVADRVAEPRRERVAQIVEAEVADAGLAQRVVEMLAQVLEVEHELAAAVALGQQLHGAAPQVDEAGAPPFVSTSACIAIAGLSDRTDRDI